MGKGGAGGEVVAGGGGGGEGEGGVWVFRLPGVDELEGDGGFADAGGVDVNVSGRGVLSVKSDTFEEGSVEATAFDHFEDPTGKGEEEQNRQK